MKFKLLLLTAAMARGTAASTSAFQPVGLELRNAGQTGQQEHKIPQQQILPWNRVVSLPPVAIPNQTKALVLLNSSVYWAHSPVAQPVDTFGASGRCAAKQMLTDGSS